MTTSIACPHCRRSDIVRMPPRTIVERILGFVRILPLRCSVCQCRFLKWVGWLSADSVVMERRQHVRIPVQLYLSFSGGRIRGEGHVVDLSIGGCMIESHADVRVDDIFYLEIALPDEEVPVEVAAMVRSVSGRGISFQFLRKFQENKRLQAFIQGQSQHSTVAPDGSTPAPPSPPMSRAM